MKTFDFGTVDSFYSVSVYTFFTFLLASFYVWFTMLAKFLVAIPIDHDLNIGFVLVRIVVWHEAIVTFLPVLFTEREKLQFFVGVLVIDNEMCGFFIHLCGGLSFVCGRGWAVVDRMFYGTNQNEYLMNIYMLNV